MLHCRKKEEYGRPGSAAPLRSARRVAHALACGDAQRHGGRAAHEIGGAGVLRDVVITGACRTPVGRYGGTLRDLPAQQLGELVIRETLRRSNVAPERVDEVIFGHVLVNGESPNVARLAALRADLPLEVPAYTIDRQCSSGLQAICNAALLVETGAAEIVVAGGVESMSTMEYYVVGARWGLRLGNTELYDRWTRGVETVSCPEKFGPIGGMIHTGENVAKKFGITREESDIFALRSHRNACDAIATCRFSDEIVPVALPQKRGDPVVFERDEHPRCDTTLEQLAKLPPLLGPGNLVTAGNAAGMNDAAAACVVTTPERARELGAQPQARLIAWSAAGCDPAIMGIGPLPAVKKVMAKTGLTLDDMGLIELNEAFAAQALAVLKELGIGDLSRVNVNGSGISIGHPVGATGARIAVTLVHEMRRREVRYGLETMCVGGGMGMAAIWELV
ncbi:MAG: acetyl-CoA C-acetyltransferase [Chloroflexi bacterium]|nr:acetyl-CoA C-acetyltransferase [Chloroflexota bacterium]